MKTKIYRTLDGWIWKYESEQIGKNKYIRMIKHLQVINRKPYAENLIEDLNSNSVKR